jgi:HD-GYP domain-containing protein (c-di-GMP phosphodiesterase class II)
MSTQDRHDTDHLEWVPAEALGRGLYVAVLDRPWVETPFLFQGFTIGGDADLSALREHCEQIAVDPERSSVAAMKTLRRALRDRQGTATGRSRRPGSRDTGEAFGAARQPDTRHFRGMVRAAQTIRQGTRRAVEGVMEELRCGRIADSAAARHAVEDLTTAVSTNASAVLWLTNLKDRDEYTSIHCVNVCVFALAFGRHLGLERDELLPLGVGALLHDVGKTRTPDGVLEKAGPLTAAEFETIKRHPEDGYQLVRSGGRISTTALDVIRLHHERLHGGGYPFGLSGEQLSLPVRIAGLADSYDAMTTHRPYRQGMAPERVLHSLYTQGGPAFGDELVQEFIRCIGIFPVGSVVQLDNGAVGVVVAVQPEARLQPMVLMLRRPDGQPQHRRQLVNLAATMDTASAAGDAAQGGRRVAKTLSPDALDVDLAALVASNFGLNGT